LTKCRPARFRTPIFESGLKPLRATLRAWCLREGEVAPLLGIDARRPRRVTEPQKGTGMGTPTRAGRALGELAITSRPLHDYRNMFLLSDAELVAGPILDCPPARLPSVPRSGPAVAP